MSACGPMGDITVGDCRASFGAQWSSYDVERVRTDASSVKLPRD